MKRYIAAALVLLVAALTLCRAEEEAPVIPLWEGLAPYTTLMTLGQDQPHLTAFEAEDAQIAVIVCPGGGYYTLSTPEGRAVAERMRKDGISGFVLNYRLSPCHYMAPLTDALRATRTGRGRASRYVGGMGFSAGGNLACNAATHWEGGDPAADDPVERLSCRPDFLVSCYAVVSFTDYPQARSVSSLLGDDAGDPELMRFFSAEQNVTAETPPAYIWHAAGDRVIPARQSLLLAGALAAAGVDYEIHIFPEGKHGIALARKYPGIRDWPDECVRFIRRVCR